MFLKWWAPEEKAPPVRLPGPPPKRGDFFKRMVTLTQFDPFGVLRGKDPTFMSRFLRVDKKHRQRGLRHGLSKKEWEKQNGKEWVAL